MDARMIDRERTAERLLAASAKHSFDPGPTSGHVRCAVTGIADECRTPRCSPARSRAGG